MNTFRLFCLTLLVFSLAAVTSARASAIVNPTAATASSTYGGAGIGRTTNYSGLSGSSTTLDTGAATPNTGSWPTDATTGHTADDYLSDNTQTVTITYDLGQEYTLGDIAGRSFHMYNYNEVSNDGSRGIRTASIYYQGAGGSISDPTGSYSLVLANASFAAAPSAASYQGEDYGYLNGIAARFVRFEVTQNWIALQPAGGNFTGMSEIRFIIPEPSSIALMGLGLAALCGYRRRHSR